MKRRFLLAKDGSPTNIYVEFVTTDTSGEVFVETSNRVTWAIISQPNVMFEYLPIMNGPIFFDASDAGGGPIYDIRHADITNDSGVEYEEDSLQIFLNGQELTRDVDYEETVDGGFYYRFEIINVGTTGLPEYPDSNDVFSIVYRTPQLAASLSGNEFLQISELYPDVSTGLTIQYSNFNIGETVKLEIVYR